MTHNSFLSIFVFLSLAFAVSAQGDNKNVLFIGNSYTYVNNLPLMIDSVAHSMGDTLTYGSNTPGGCTFQQHCSNGSMTLIRQGGWDVVVLQEQSQLPSFPESQVQAQVYPYAEQLVDSIVANNPDALPMFYMTWGHKNGDPTNAVAFPVLSTYEGMDSMIYLRYMCMAQENGAVVCPVGRVWRYLRTYYPGIELFQADNSHPSVAGSYAAACAFYTMIFGRSPLACSYKAGLSDSVVAKIWTAVDVVVYQNIADWLFEPTPACDTVYITDTVYVHDTVFIHDTVYITTGVYDASSESIVAYADGRQIVIRGASGLQVQLFDASGRIVATRKDGDEEMRLDVPGKGSYLIKVDGYSVRKIVVAR